MKISALAFAAAMALLPAAAAAASSDCHQDMKDMLEGTLEVNEEARNKPSDATVPQGCTLASGQGHKAVVNAA